MGIITGPLPLGAVALLGLGVCILTHTLTFAQAFSAMANEIPWLIALAFFFARGFIRTGLGNRIAYHLVALFGSTSLGLTYSLVLSEALLAPAIPSVAARAGGIFLPLVTALAQACGSNKGDGTERKIGAYLFVTCFQTSCVSSAMFLTSMAANPLSAKLAFTLTGTEITWGQWALAASVPGVVSLIVVPLVLYVLYPPSVSRSPEAPAEARTKLDAMGPATVDELIMAFALLVTVGLWIAGSFLGVGSVAAATVGLAILLLSGVLQWKDCLAETTAWDTLTWFGALIAMANALNGFGLIKWFAATVTQLVGGLPAAAAVTALVLVYFYSHYLFASGAAHIGAMYAAFLAVAVSLKAPPLATALLLAFLSNLMGGLDPLRHRLRSPVLRPRLRAPAAVVVHRRRLQRCQPRHLGRSRRRMVGCPGPFVSSLARGPTRPSRIPRHVPLSTTRFHKPNLAAISLFITGGARGIHPPTPPPPRDPRGAGGHCVL
eukprot:TRINITY_DN465_c0_g1_i1.p1 TRINITY_DN465_c0_g1~~TRINITY_DN465_c0_g1_i1.p1  ORF type:complete len:491 (-),score=154.57 TRINITY_DN465_c0_g1_i1:71-1543(-)